MLRSPTKDGQKETLQRFLSPANNLAQNYTGISDYISALSTYLCKKDDAYHYNYSFLVRQNSEFREFLDKAAIKRNTLIDFTARLTHLAQFPVLTKQENSVDLIVASLNDFWEVNVPAGDCFLSENFSISGATCMESSDIVTLRHSGHTVSFSPRINDDYLRQIVCRFLCSGQVHEDE